MTSEAAALTEQEREQVSAACWQGVALPQLFAVIESIVAARARLADSRPAVTEAAIEAAANALDRAFIFDHIGVSLHDAAEVALSAALPHMGDGKADAWDEALQEVARRLESCDDDEPEDWANECLQATHAANPYRLSPTGDDR